jgi:hypothetical protein
VSTAAGTPRSDFVNAFDPAISGFEYVPLGGDKDGGADGFQDEPIDEESAHPDRFLQASIQREFNGKIRHAVARLRESGRTPTTGSSM